jgi:oxygen-independent coproporphyrinogen III oxidase
MAGIYFHIPFCKQACHYCDFHFSTNLDVRDELLRAMATEIELQQSYLQGESIKTVYFGGGTPSLLRGDQVKDLLDQLRRFFVIEENAEVTLEANPDDLTSSVLKEFKVAGINRLSIGIQSFDDHVLKFFNRAHDSRMAMECITRARDSGFENISLDLIYAIPGQGDDAWKRNIEKAIALQPHHISAYSLTIEKGTAFGNWLVQGKVKSVDDDVSAGQLEILIRELADAGYEHYEISNFCRRGFYSQHNSSYWKGQRYLGLGPSAHSYDLISRQFNVRNNHLYVRSLKEGKVPFEREVLTREDHVNEYLMTTLRTQWGCDLEKLKTEFQYDVYREHAAVIDGLLKGDMAIIDNNHFKLINRGRYLADAVSADLFLVARPPV